MKMLAHEEVPDDSSCINRNPLAIFLALLFFGLPLLSIATSGINESPYDLEPRKDEPLETTGFSSSTYYSSANGLTGDALHSALYEIIRNHTVVSYSWDPLRTTDQAPDNPANVTLIYMQRSQSENNTCGDGNTCTSESWNREHLWPKSHGDFGTSSTKRAGTDLHALRPSDNTVNSARGNKDFDEVATSHGECTSCGSSSDAWEPPDEVKGDIARAMFYMDVRYNGYGNEPNLTLVDSYTSTSSDDGQLGKLCTMYQWNFDDPVDSNELTRNSRVYSLQSNRNPFVDNPSYVAEIWGFECDADIDGDSILNQPDACPDGAFGWTSSSANDLDGDGCVDDTGWVSSLIFESNNSGNEGDGVLDLEIDPARFMIALLKFGIVLIGFA